VLRKYKCTEPEILEGTTIEGVESTTILRTNKTAQLALDGQLVSKCGDLLKRIAKEFG